jgi:hypothetical protein
MLRRVGVTPDCGDHREPSRFSHRRVRGAVEAAAGNEVGTIGALQGAQLLFSALVRADLPAPTRNGPGHRRRDACLGVKGSRVQIPPSRRFFERTSDPNRLIFRSHCERRRPRSVPSSVASGNRVAFEVTRRGAEQGSALTRWKVREYPLESSRAICAHRRQSWFSRCRSGNSHRQDPAPTGSTKRSAETGACGSPQCFTSGHVF